MVNPVVPSFQVTEPEQFATVKVAELPAHIVGLLTVGVGFGVTVTVLVAVPVPEQLPELTVQVAVYDVVEVGLTVLVNPVVPSFQVTVPEQLFTVKVADCPTQIAGLFTLGVGVATLETVTVPVAVAVPIQGAVPSVQVTV